jgi:hypothetical protein
MAFAATYSHSGSDHFLPQHKTRSDRRKGLKTRLCERYNLSDCQNTAFLGLFLNGARIGLRLDPKKGDPGSIRAQISVSQIGWKGG